MNVDRWRGGFAARLSGAAVADPPIPDDGVPDDPENPRAMGGRDALRDRDIGIPAPYPNQPARCQREHVSATVRFQTSTNSKPAVGTPTRPSQRAGP